MIYGSNTAGPFDGMTRGAHIEQFSGPRDVNPFVKGAGGSDVLTPYIRNLVGGAECFGLLDGIDSRLPAFESLDGVDIDGAPALLYRMHTGPGEYDYDFTGFDLLLYMNLTDRSLPDPVLGVGVEPGDPSARHLEQGGYVNPAGPIVLESLQPYGICGVLVPEGSSFVTFGACGCQFLTSAEIGPGEYLLGLIPGDANRDYRVNILDLIHIRNHLGDDPGSSLDAARADVNGDGKINVLDLIFARNHLGTGCQD